MPGGKKRSKITKDKVLFLIFVLAWAGLSLIASQFIVSFPLKLILGDKAGEPLWVLVYYVLSYLIALALIIFIPPRLWQKLIALHTEKPTKKSKDSKAAKSRPLITTQDPSEYTTTPAELGVGEWPTFVDIGLAPIGYIAYMIIASALTGIMSIFSWFNLEESQNVGFSYFLTTSDRILALIAIVFVAPIAEEIIMRGWLYGKIRRKLGFIASVIITSLFFGLLHGQWNVGVTVFALSLVLCSLREITGTIWSGILLHVLSNGIAFYILYVAGMV